MKKWKAIAGACLVFVLGMAAGGLVTGTIIKNRVKHFLDSGPQGMGDVIVKRLSADLRLDATQRDKLQAVVDHARSEIQSARREFQPRIASILTDSESEIRSILKPEQVKKFDWIVEKRQEVWHKFN